MPLLLPLFIRYKIRKKEGNQNKKGRHFYFDILSNVIYDISKKNNTSFMAAFQSYILSDFGKYYKHLLIGTAGAKIKSGFQSSFLFGYYILNIGYISLSNGILNTLHFKIIYSLYTYIILKVSYYQSVDGHLPVELILSDSMFAFGGPLCF